MLISSPPCGALSVMTSVTWIWLTRVPETTKYACHVSPPYVILSSSTINPMLPCILSKKSGRFQIIVLCDHFYLKNFYGSWPFLKLSYLIFTRVWLHLLLAPCFAIIAPYRALKSTYPFQHFRLHLFRFPHPPSLFNVLLWILLGRTF